MKWTAFLRLKGDTSARNKGKIPAEFQELAVFLQCIGLEYELIVLVEGKGSRVIHPLNPEQTWEAWTRDKESGI